MRNKTEKTERHPFMIFNAMIAGLRDFKNNILLLFCCDVWFFS
jgi:hypothetical protein